MKTRRKFYKDKSNSYYLKFAEFYIDNLFTDLKNKSALNYLEKKLTNDEYKKLNEISIKLALRKVIDLEKKVIRDKIEAKVRKIEMSELLAKAMEGEETIRAYNNYITEPAKKEFENYHALIKTEKDFKKSFTDFLEKFDKKYFLQIIAKVLYLLAVFETKENLYQLTNLQKSWQAEFAQTVQKLKGKRRGEQAKELLKIILGDKIEDMDAIKKEEEKDIEKYGIRSFNISINLDEELDLNRLDQGDYSIETMKFHFPDAPQIIDNHYKTIHITIDKIPQVLSLDDYYKLKIDSFLPEILRSKDLLDNILILYVIKRSQNGDEKAFEKLFNCYKKDAEGLAVNFITKKAHEKGLGLFPQGGKLSHKDVKAVVVDILSGLLTGDNPSSLFKYLDKKKEDRPEVGILLHRRIHKILMESYNIRYNWLLAVIKTMHSKQQVFKRQIRNIKYRMGKAIKLQKESIELEYLLKMFTISLRQLHWVSTNSSSAIATLTPYNLAIYSPSFNKKVFKPTKKTKLTTWLFGPNPKSGKFQGMLWFELNNWYKCMHHKGMVELSDFKNSIDMDVAERELGKKKEETTHDYWEDVEKDRENWQF